MDPDPYVYDSDHVDKLYGRCEERKAYYPTFGVFLTSGLPIGLMNLKRIDRENSRCELAIVLSNHAYKGKGYGSEAVQLLVEYAFYGLNLDHINSDTMGSNIRMQRIMDRLGFQLLNREERRYDMHDRWEDKLNYQLDKSSYRILHIAPLTEADAHNVCTWRYEGTYAVYNFPDWDTVVAQDWGIADEATRCREFYSLRNAQEALVGFFRLHEQEDCLLLSLGLKPEYCGRGMGEAAMALIIAEAKRKAPDKRLELEVRAFNQRAIACYKRCGFAAVEQYAKQTPMGGEPFIRMALGDHC